MLSYNEIKERRYIILDNTPYEVLSSHVSRKQSQKPTNQTKLRNLITGGVSEKNFHTSDVVKEADVTRETAVYAFSKFNRQTDETEYWFVDPDDKSNRFTIKPELVADIIKYVKQNSEIDIIKYENDDEEKIPIGIKIPVKVELAVKEAPPAVKGNTATGATKQITLETGLIVNTPLFINEGDVVRINTDTGEYVERV